MTSKWQPSAPRSATSSHTLVQKHARSQGYSFAGPVSISIVPDDSLSTGTLRVESSTAQGRVAWRGVVDVEGKRHPLTNRAPSSDAARRRHHHLGRGHQPQARRDPLGRRARDGARHELHQRHHAERPPGERGRPAAGFDRHVSAAPTSCSASSRRRRRRSRRCPPKMPRAPSTSANEDPSRE